MPHVFAVQFEDGAVGENAGHAVGVTSFDDTDAHGPLGGKDAAIADALPCCQFAHGADSGDKAHDGGELDLAAHKVAVDAAVEDNPGAAHIEGVGGLFDDGRAVGAVADGKVDATLLTALDDGHQAAELKVTVLRVLIGSGGKVGEDAFGLNFRELQGSRDGVDRFFLIVFAGGKAEAGHAGIELDVDEQRTAAGRGMGAQLARVSCGLFRRREALAQLFFGKNGGGLRGAAAEQQDGTFQAVFAQVKGFFKGRYGEEASTLFTSNASHLHRAVAVGIGLDNGTERAGRRYFLLDFTNIAAQRRSRNFGPDARVRAVVLSGKGFI